VASDALTRKRLLLETADALDSGEFKQGRSVLARERYDGTTYCCLGVMCEVAVRHGLLTRIHPVGGSAVQYATLDYKEQADVLLPPTIAALLHGVGVAEVEDRDGSVDPYVFGAETVGLTGRLTYSEVNDDQTDSHMTFPEIAATFRAWAASLPDEE
jgi:hypothetical protein